MLFGFQFIALGMYVYMKAEQSVLSSRVYMTDEAAQKIGVNTTYEYLRARVSDASAEKVDEVLSEIAELDDYCIHKERARIWNKEGSRFYKYSAALSAVTVSYADNDCRCRCRFGTRLYSSESAVHIYTRRIWHKKCRSSVAAAYDTDNSSSGNSHGFCVLLCNVRQNEETISL